MFVLVNMHFMLLSQALNITTNICMLTHVHVTQTRTKFADYKKLNLGKTLQTFFFVLNINIISCHVL